MKRLPLRFGLGGACGALLLSILPLDARAEETALKCFYTGLPAKPGLAVEYEGATYGFCSDANKKKFAAALGAPTPWTGKDMRKAHEHLDLREEDFAAIADNLQKTLAELKLEEKVVGEIMAIVASTKDEVLNR